MSASSGTAIACPPNPALAAHGVCQHDDERGERELDVAQGFHVSRNRDRR